MVVTAAIAQLEAVPAHQVEIDKFFFRITSTAAITNRTTSNTEVLEHALTVIWTPDFTFSVGFPIMTSLPPGRESKLGSQMSQKWKRRLMFVSKS
jgi:hypothetical protein